MITDAIGMDLDTNNIEQIAYSKSEILNSSGVVQEFHEISLLRSLAGKDTGRIDPTPTSIITYDDDSVEGEVLSGDLNADGMDDLVYTDPDGNGTISIHYGSASGVGALADRILVGSFSDSNLGTGIAIGDFNCDGFDDMLPASWNGNQQFWTCFYQIGFILWNFRCCMVGDEWQ